MKLFKLIITPFLLLIAMMGGAMAAPAVPAIIQVAASAVVKSAVTKLALSVAASFIVNKLFAPDQPSSQGGAATQAPDQGVKQRLQTDTANKLPVVYGRSRVFGSIWFADITSNNQEMAFIVPLCEGSIESIDKIIWDDYTLTFDGNISTGLRNVTRADDRQGVRDNFLNGNLRVRAFPTGGRCSEMESFSSRWGANGNRRAMPNIAYLYVELTYDRDNSVTGLSTRFGAEVRGRKVRTFNSAGELSGTNVEDYSNNPAECLLDYLTSNIYGCNIKLDDIDIPSFFSASQFCDEQVTHDNTSGVQVTSARYTCNGFINTSENRDIAISDIVTNSQCNLAYSLGKFQMVPDRVGSSVYTFTEENTYGDVAIINDGFSTVLNRLEMSFNSAENIFQDDQVFLSTPSIRRSTNEPDLIKSIRSKFNNNSVEVQRWGTTLLNKSRNNLTVSFQTDLRALSLQVNDIITVHNNTYNFVTGVVNSDFEPLNANSQTLEEWVNAGHSADSFVQATTPGKLFRITAITETALVGGLPGFIIAGQEYAAADYEVGVLQEADTAANTGLPNPRAFGDILDLTSNDSNPNGDSRYIDLTLTIPTGITEDIEIYSGNSINLPIADRNFLTTISTPAGTFTSGTLYTHRVSGLENTSMDEDIVFWVRPVNQFAKGAFSNAYNYGPFFTAERDITDANGIIFDRNNPDVPLGADHASVQMKFADDINGSGIRNEIAAARPQQDAPLVGSINTFNTVNPTTGSGSITLASDYNSGTSVNEIQQTEFSGRTVNEGSNQVVNFNLIDSPSNDEILQSIRNGSRIDGYWGPNNISSIYSPGQFENTGKRQNYTVTLGSGTTTNGLLTVLPGLDSAQESITIDLPSTTAGAAGLAGEISKATDSDGVSFVATVNGGSLEVNFPPSFRDATLVLTTPTQPGQTVVAINHADNRDFRITSVLINDFYDLKQVLENDINNPSTPNDFGSATAIGDNIAFVQGQGGIFAFVYDAEEDEWIFQAFGGQGPVANNMLTTNGTLAIWYELQNIRVYEYGERYTPPTLVYTENGVNIVPGVISGDGDIVAWLDTNDNIVIINGLGDTNVKTTINTSGVFNVNSLKLVGNTIFITDVANNNIRKIILTEQSDNTFTHTNQIIIRDLVIRDSVNNLHPFTDSNLIVNQLSDRTTRITVPNDYVYTPVDATRLFVSGGSYEVSGSGHMVTCGSGRVEESTQGRARIRYSGDGNYDNNGLVPDTGTGDFTYEIVVNGPNRNQDVIQGQRYNQDLGTIGNGEYRSYRIPSSEVDRLAGQTLSARFEYNHSGGNVGEWAVQTGSDASGIITCNSSGVFSGPTFNYLGGASSAAGTASWTDTRNGQRIARTVNMHSNDHLTTAERLKTAIDTLFDYTATRTGNVIDITYNGPHAYENQEIYGYKPRTSAADTSSQSLGPDAATRRQVSTIYENDGSSWNRVNGYDLAQADIIGKGNNYVIGNSTDGYFRYFYDKTNINNATVRWIAGTNTSYTLTAYVGKDYEISHTATLPAGSSATDTLQAVADHVNNSTNLFGSLTASTVELNNYDGSSNLPGRGLIINSLFADGFDVNLTFTDNANDGTNLDIIYKSAEGGTDIENASVFTFTDPSGNTTYTFNLVNSTAEDIKLRVENLFTNVITTSTEIPDYHCRAVEAGVSFDTSGSTTNKVATYSYTPGTNDTGGFQQVNAAGQNEDQWVAAGNFAADFVPIVTESNILASTSSDDFIFVVDPTGISTNQNDPDHIMVYASDGTTLLGGPIDVYATGPNALGIPLGDPIGFDVPIGSIIQKVEFFPAAATTLIGEIVNSDGDVIAEYRFVGSGIASSGGIVTDFMLPAFISGGDAVNSYIDSFASTSSTGPWTVTFTADAGDVSFRLRALNANEEPSVAEVVDTPFATELTPKIQEFEIVISDVVDDTTELTTTVTDDQSTVLDNSVVQDDTTIYLGTRADLNNVDTFRSILIANKGIRNVTHNGGNSFDVEFIPSAGGATLSLATNDASTVTLTDGDISGGVVNDPSIDFTAQSPFVNTDLWTATIEHMAGADTTGDLAFTDISISRPGFLNDALTFTGTVPGYLPNLVFNMQNPTRLGDNLNRDEAATNIKEIIDLVSPGNLVATVNVADASGNVEISWTQSITADLGIQQGIASAVPGSVTISEVTQGSIGTNDPADSIQTITITEPGHDHTEFDLIKFNPPIVGTIDSFSDLANALSNRIDEWTFVINNNGALEATRDNNTYQNLAFESNITGAGVGISNFTVIEAGGEVPTYYALRASDNIANLRADSTNPLDYQLFPILEVLPDGNINPQHLVEVANTFSFRFNNLNQSDNFRNTPRDDVNAEIWLFNSELLTTETLYGEPVIRTDNPLNGAQLTFYNGSYYVALIVANAAARDALITTGAGNTVYRSDTNTIEVFDGVNWITQ